MLKLRVLDMFFTEINDFVIAQRVKYRKNLPLCTGTEFQVSIPVPYRFKCERYPTLHLSGSCSWLALRCEQRRPCSQRFPWALQSKIADFQITVGSHLIKDAVPSVSSWFWLFPSEDRHDRCLQCLGIQHIEAALVDDSCACCGHMSMASLRSCLSFVRSVAPSAVTHPGLSSSCRGPLAGALGDLRVTIRPSPPGKSPQTSYSSCREGPVRFPGDFADPSRAATSISFGAPPEDEMLIAASGDGYRPSRMNVRCGSPPRVLSPLPYWTRS